VVSSVGVIAGLLLVYFTGWFWMDGLVACVVGLNIVVMAFTLVRQSFWGLMDAADPDLLEEICNLLRLHRKTVWIDAHRLRAWKSGQRVHVDFHLILPRDIPLDLGHREVKELERIFGEHFGGNVELLVHLDPCQDPECPICNHDPCDLRTEQPDQPRPWHRETLTEGLNDEGLGTNEAQS
jgi:cation diffusion facilitator family transporter